jgi:hypothetical protein
MSSMRHGCLATYLPLIALGSKWMEMLGAQRTEEGSSLGWIDIALIILWKGSTTPLLRLSMSCAHEAALGEPLHRTAGF